MGGYPGLRPGLSQRGPLGLRTKVGTLLQARLMLWRSNLRHQLFF